MCGAYRAYIGRATPAQANCPFSCCIDPGQPQTISHLFITCPVAATVTDWLCRLWQAMTGYLPVVSAASLLAADTPSEQLPSDTLLQTWHRLRLAVPHSIWAASQIAQATRSTQPSDTSEPDAIMASSPSSQQVFFFFFFWVTGELSTLRQMMKVPNEPGLSPNNDLENAFLSDQSMASNPRKGQAKPFFFFFFFWEGEIFITRSNDNNLKEM